MHAHVVGSVHGAGLVGRHPLHDQRLQVADEQVTDVVAFGNQIQLCLDNPEMNEEWNEI